MTRISIALISILFLLSPENSIAQVKIAHLNTNKLIVTMPETDSANAQIQKLNEELTRTFEELQVEYNKAYVDYESKVATMTDLIRKTKEDALRNMMGRIQEFESLSQQELSNKRDELFEPILIKAQNAIQEVADEKGFDYVLDTGTGAILTVPKDKSKDILELVQAKLGIKTE